MADVNELLFEVKRRVVLFNSGTTMPDNNPLGYEGNPNSANTSTAGQTLLYNSPRGTHYIELVNGNLWYKQQIPNTWINLTSGTSSGTATFSSQNNVVYTTGDQNIAGIKNFYSRPTVNGAGVLLIGETASVDLPNTIVYTTGNQTINGTKTFDVAPILSGNPFITGVNLSSYITNATLNDVVYTTGDQNISGIKTFTQTGSFDTIQITNKKLSSYSYNSTNFIFGNTYINIANSSNNIIGTLPSGITSGINYYVKNLNTGILLITGSGQRTIDGFSNINLYKNESLQLLGVNNVGYTGWVTLSADNGVS